MEQKYRKNGLSSAVFLIGLAVLLVTGWWFPGFLFLISACIFAQAIEQSKPLQNATAAFLLIGIGLVFGFPELFQAINWKIVLVVILLVFAWSILFSKKPPAYDENERPDNDDDESGYV